MTGAFSRTVSGAVAISYVPFRVSAAIIACAACGATGVMFSESFAGGTVRMVREATKHLTQPPAIYGHNAGIGVPNMVSLPSAFSGTRM